MLTDSVFARLSGAIAMALALAACSHHEAPVETIRPVQLLQVKVGAAGEQAVYAGEVKPRHEADLGFRIGGKIVARLVDVGGTVKAGQVLARLDPADVGLQAEAAKAQLAAGQLDGLEVHLGRRAPDHPDGRPRKLDQSRTGPGGVQHGAA